MKQILFFVGFSLLLALASCKVSSGSGAAGGASGSGSSAEGGGPAFNEIEDECTRWRMEITQKRKNIEKADISEVQKAQELENLRQLEAKSKDCN